MNMLVSRRDFLRGSAAITLAVAASGLLAGCSGPSATEANLGDYKVDVVGRPESYWKNEEGKGYLEPSLRITSVNGSILELRSWEISAAIGGTALQQRGSLPSLVVQGFAQKVNPKFTTTDKAAFDAMLAGRSTLKLTIVISGQRAVYAYNAATGAWSLAEH